MSEETPNKIIDETIVAGQSVEPEESFENIPQVDFEDLSKEDKLKYRGREFLSYLADGLNESDAQILAELDDSELETLRENTRFDKLVARKKLEYKHKLVKTLNKAATDDDSASALRILQSQYPEEYAPKRGAPEAPTNPISVIINQIQSGDNRTLPPAFKEARVIHDTKQGEYKEVKALDTVDARKKIVRKETIREQLMGGNSRVSEADNPKLIKKRGRTRKS